MFSPKVILFVISLTEIIYVISFTEVPNVIFSWPATSFSFPRKDYVLTAILSPASPITATGRTYALTEIDVAEAKIFLK